MEIYVIGGLEFIIPVHAIVIIFGFSTVPQVTIAIGTGQSKVPGFKFFLGINKFLSVNFVLKMCGRSVK